MYIVTFLAISGALGWLWLAWRMLRRLRQLYRRLRWALFGPRKARPTPDRSVS